MDEYPDFELLPPPFRPPTPAPAPPRKSRLAGDIAISVVANIIAGPVLYRLGQALELWPPHRTAVLVAMTAALCTSGVLLYLAQAGRENWGGWRLDWIGLSLLVVAGQLLTYLPDCPWWGALVLRVLPPVLLGMYLLVEVDLWPTDVWRRRAGSNPVQ